MHIDGAVVLASAVVGLLVGSTGAGGGALMTPMLILLFSVKPSTAISSDLVAAVLMRPFGAAVHLRKRTVNLRLVGLLATGSVPAAFLGAYLLHRLGSSSGAGTDVERLLGAALLLGATAMVVRVVLDRRAGATRTLAARELRLRPLPTVAIGVVGGIIVGMTSVGAGSLMIVLLLFAYPRLRAGTLVGTDLTQAVPLTLAAAAGAALWGHVSLPLTTSIVIGAVPAVLVGSALSSRAPDHILRPIITLVILASGLKYAGMGTTDLGWAIVAAIAVGAAGWLVLRRLPTRAATSTGQTPDPAAAGRAADPVVDLTSAPPTPAPSAS